MKAADFDAYLDTLFHPERFSHADSSMNGLQVARSDDSLSRIACAVDASLETFARAAAWRADALFVHHGLFWGSPLAVRGAHRARLAALIAGDIALYAMHLPLDAHPEIGNNAAIAAALGLTDVTPFAEYHGVDIGASGSLPEPLAIEDVAARLFGGRENVLAMLPFGPDRIRTVGIVSGGASREVVQAAAHKLDLYITGEAGHEMYHTALEAGVSVIAGGHYRTEVFGPKTAAARFARDLGVETVFLDVPTGL